MINRPRFPWISAAATTAGIIWVVSAWSHAVVIRDRTEAASREVLARIDGTASLGTVAVSGNYRHAHGLLLDNAIGIAARAGNDADGMVILGTATHAFRFQPGGHLVVSGQRPITAEIRLLRPFPGTIIAQYLVCGCERMPSMIGLILAASVAAAALVLLGWRMGRFLRWR